MVQAAPPLRKNMFRLTTALWMAWMFWRTYLQAIDVYGSNYCEN